MQCFGLIDWWVCWQSASYSGSSRWFGGRCCCCRWTSCGVSRCQWGCRISILVILILVDIIVRFCISLLSMSLSSAFIFRRNAPSWIFISSNPTCPHPNFDKRRFHRPYFFCENPPLQWRMKGRTEGGMNDVVGGGRTLTEAKWPTQDQSSDNWGSEYALKNYGAFALTISGKFLWTSSTIFGRWMQMPLMRIRWNGSGLFS